MQRELQQTDQRAQTSQPPNNDPWSQEFLINNDPNQPWTQPQDYVPFTLAPDVAYSTQNQTYSIENGPGADSSMGAMARGTSAPGAPNSHQYRQSLNQPMSYSIPLTRRHSHCNSSPEFASPSENFGSFLARAVPPTSYEPVFEQNLHHISDASPSIHHQNFPTTTNSFLDQAQYPPTFANNVQPPPSFTGGHPPSAKALETETLAGQWSYDKMWGLGAHHEALNKSSLHPFIAPNTPTTSELTMASTAASDMSRQSSNIDPLLLRDGLSFMQAQPITSPVPVNSLSSFHGDFTPLFPSSSSVTGNGPAISCADNERFPSVTVTNSNVGCYDFDLSFSFPMSLGCSRERAGHVAEDFDLSVASNVNPVACSHVSSMPPTSPITENAQKARPLAPKASPYEITSPQDAHGDSMTAQLASGQHSTKRAIPKAPYTRRTLARKMCPHCHEHPQGFRGDHELRRHHARVHSTLRSMWICVDNSPDQTFLARCKACRSGKKYAADYNAAAHLRRTHFNARKRGYGRGKANQNRGGMGGGDKPSMEELRKWIKEVEEIATDNLKDDLESEPKKDDDGEPKEKLEVGVPSSSTSLPPHASGDEVAPSKPANTPAQTLGLENRSPSSLLSTVPPGYIRRVQQFSHPQPGPGDLAIFSGSDAYSQLTPPTNYPASSRG